MAFGWLTEQGPSQAIAESQVGTYPVLILREEFKLILMDIRGGIFVCLIEDCNIAKQEVSPLLLKATARWTDVQKAVNAVIDAEKCPFTFFFFLLDKSILCGVLPDNPGHVIEGRVVGVQIAVGSKSKDLFTVVEIQARGTTGQILKRKVGVNVRRYSFAKQSDRLAENGSVGIRVAEFVYKVRSNHHRESSRNVRAWSVRSCSGNTRKVRTYGKSAGFFSGYRVMSVFEERA